MKMMRTIRKSRPDCCFLAARRKVKRSVCGNHLKYLAKHLRQVHGVTDQEQRRQAVRESEEVMSLLAFAQMLYRFPFTLKELQLLRDKYGQDLKGYVEGGELSDGLKDILMNMHSRYK